MLRKWALVYYPELIFYMYDFDLTYEEFLKNKTQWLANTKAIIKRDYARLGKFEHPEDAVINLIEHYKKTADYNCPKEQATKEVEYCLNQYEKLQVGDYALEDDYTFPIMNTPMKVDLYLKWHCPVPCVRKYLEEHCGYKTKWYHKLFWKGKKHFL
jgi:hypothetical protein